MADLARWLAELVLLASLMAGEAPDCGPAGKIAVYHVWHNRIASGIIDQEAGWYGWREPAAQDLALVLLASRTADPTGGAVFLMGDGDLHKPAVRWLLANRTATARFPCETGYLEAYR